MKSFASALLVAGAFAAQKAIEFGQDATFDIGASNLLNWQGRQVYSATSGDAAQMGATTVKWELLSD